MAYRVKQDGFTLIELLVAIVIVGVVAAIAFPAFKESGYKAKRTEAPAILAEVAQRMEGCRTLNGRYIQDADPQCGIVNELQTAPGVRSLTGMYFVTLSNEAAATYTLTARVNEDGKQATDEACFEFTLTHTGVRAATMKDGTDNTDTCW